MCKHRINFATMEDAMEVEGCNGSGSMQWNSAMEVTRTQSTFPVKVRMREAWFDLWPLFAKIQDGWASWQKTQDSGIAVILIGKARQISPYLYWWLGIACRTEDMYERVTIVSCAEYCPLIVDNYGVEVCHEFCVWLIAVLCSFVPSSVLLSIQSIMVWTRASDSPTSPEYDCTLYHAIDTQMADSSKSLLEKVV